MTTRQTKLVGAWLGSVAAAGRRFGSLGVRALGVGILVLATACATSRGPDHQPPEPLDARDRSASIEVAILQINDVYEIGPVAGGTKGGLARVAEVRRRLLEENPNTLTVLAGDFLSPSALGTAWVEGDQLAGKQMIATLNAMGLDLATIGNHEFDIGEERLASRLAESEFRWTSSNVSRLDGTPFPGVSRHEVLTYEGPGESSLRIAVVGALLEEMGEDWVSYEEPLSAVRREIDAIGKGREGGADVVVALTHLSLFEDQQLAESIPEIDLVVGGHEHENYLLRRGAGRTPIAKADANAKSVYVHRLTWYPQRRELEIDSEYLPITDAMPSEPATASVVADWTERAFEGFRALGFDPDALVAKIDRDLDGLESSVRNRRTHLTRLITAGMLREVPAADLAILNSGSIRIDDRLEAGPVTQYDILRVLPYGGDLFVTAIGGALLERVLDQGIDNRGTGGFLQTSEGVGRDATGAWTVNGVPVSPERTYTAVLTDYLAQGNEVNLDYLDVDAGDPEFSLLATHRDIRLAMIEEMVARYPGE